MILEDSTWFRRLVKFIALKIAHFDNTLLFFLLNVCIFITSQVANLIKHFIFKIGGRGG